MTTYADVLLGRILIAKGFRLEQLTRCLEKVTPGRPLVDVLVADGHLTLRAADHLQRCVAHQQFLRGELLLAQQIIRRGLLTQAAVDAALEHQRHSQYRERLADILHRRGLIDQQRLEALLDEQLIALAEDLARIEADGVLGSGPRGQPPGVKVSPHAATVELPDLLPDLTETSDGLDLAAALPAPPPVPDESPVTPHRVQRAFDSGLLMAGVDGVVRRCDPKPGQSPLKNVRVIFDLYRELYKAPLLPRIASGDRLELEDGTRWRVRATEPFLVDGTACYQLVRGDRLP